MQAANSTFFDVAPYRLSGHIVGVLMNDPAALAALGDAVHAPPYKAPPSAPVLYVKPRNTLVPDAGPVFLPPGVPALDVGVALGLLIGRTACRVTAAAARAHISGLLVAADLSVPHTSFYRPSVRFKALDGSCRLSRPVVAAGVDPDDLVLRVLVDGELLHTATTRGFTRHAAQLLADVSEFMTLHPGDVLLTGVPRGAPRVRGGQSARLEIPGVGALDLAFERESA